MRDFMKTSPLQLPNLGGGCRSRLVGKSGDIDNTTTRAIPLSTILRVFALLNEELKAFSRQSERVTNQYRSRKRFGRVYSAQQHC